MEQKLTVSVIIPTHNRAYIIKQCIDSILNQTYKDFELIIIDDHSEDNTLELLGSISDPRLKIVKLQEKKGAQAARNEGIKNASGEWICFNDSDDFWIENKLEIQVKYIKKLHFKKNIVLYTDCFRYKEEINKKHVWHLTDIKPYSSYKSLLASPGPMFQGLFFHKSLIVSSGLLDESVPSYQEWDTSLLLAKNHAKFFHIKKPLFIYNLHSGGTISQNMVSNFNGYQFIINKYKGDILKYCGKEVWKDHIIKQYKKMIKHVIPKLITPDNTIIFNNANIIFYEIELNCIKNKRKIKSFLKKTIKI